MDNKDKKIKKRFLGSVLNLTGERTLRIKVEIKKRHPKYGKIIKSHKNYLVDYDPNTELGKDIKIGDVIIAEESKPISKNKYLVLVEKQAE